MTLEEFFTRCIEKVSKDEQSPNATGGTVSRKYEHSAAHFNTLLIEAKKTKAHFSFSHSAVNSSWSYVLSKTKGTDFFDEFRGDVELKEALKEFLQEAPPPSDQDPIL